MKQNQLVVMFTLGESDVSCKFALNYCFMIYHGNKDSCWQIFVIYMIYHF